jgi:hypothetical protein
MGSRLARFCLAISISLLFVWLAFRDLDLPALGQAFGRIGLPAAAL